jgi:hypothetical protein
MKIKWTCRLCQRRYTPTDNANPRGLEMYRRLQCRQPEHVRAPAQARQISAVTQPKMGM